MLGRGLGAISRANASSTCFITIDCNTICAFLRSRALNMVQNKSKMYKPSLELSRSPNPNTTNSPPLLLTHISSPNVSKRTAWAQVSTAAEGNGEVVVTSSDVVKSSDACADEASLDSRTTGIRSPLSNSSPVVPAVVLALEVPKKRAAKEGCWAGDAGQPKEEEEEPRRLEYRAAATLDCRCWFVTWSRKLCRLCSRSSWMVRMVALISFSVPEQNTKSKLRRPKNKNTTSIRRLYVLSIVWKNPETSLLLSHQSHWRSLFLARRISARFDLLLQVATYDIRESNKMTRMRTKKTTKSFSFSFSYISLLCLSISLIPCYLHAKKTNAARNYGESKNCKNDNVHEREPNQGRNRGTPNQS